MDPIKHVGKIKSNGAKVIVAFRTLPGESNYALVLPIAQLSDSYHDAIMKTVETNEAQAAFEFGEVMFTRTFPDGRPMLQAMRADGLLQKVATDSVIMTPVPGAEVELSQLNSLIAEQKNCAVDELYTFVAGAPKKVEEPEVAEESNLGRDIGEPNVPKSTKLQANANEALSDADLAKSYRSQADALYKEAARLRKQAEELDPTVKKTAKTKETADA